MIKASFKDGTTEYFRFKLSRERHNYVFPNRKVKWNDKWVYYTNHMGTIILHRYINISARVLITLLFPAMIVIHGLGNIKELWEELIDMWFQSEKRTYISDICTKGSDAYIRLMESEGRV